MKVTVAIQCGTVIAADDCWIPCNYRHGSCVSIQCRTDSRATFECNMISTVMQSHQAKTPRQTCISPAEVPGMPQFCSELLNNGSLLLENLKKEITSKPTKPVDKKEDVTVAAGPDCISITILAGIAVGCFTAGCLVTWLFLLILWSRNNPRCYKEPSKESFTNNHRPQGTPTVRNEITPARTISMSHQCLLSSASVDSGMSSSQAVVPVSPHSQSDTPVPEIRQNTRTETTNDYTRLTRESMVSVASQEPQTNCQSSDYTSLETSGVQNMSLPRNPYQMLQSVSQTDKDKTNTASLSNSCTIASGYETGLPYPSLARSTKSETHDYESIFRDNTQNVMDADYARYGSHSDSDGDYHEYHECASNTLDRHEYFVLQEQPHEYFVLEKDG